VRGRRDNGAGSVYFEHRTGTTCHDSRYHRHCEGRWSASISLGRDGSGKRKRMRLVAKTKTELLAKMAEAQKAIDTGLEVSSAYTVGQCLDDFLAAGLEGLAPNTIDLQTRMAQHLRALLGAYKLRELTAVQVQAALRTFAATHSTRTVSMVKNTLERAIRLAQAHDKVSRNVAEVVRTPAGQKESRARRSFSLDEMFAIMDAATRWSWKNMDAFIHLGFLTGASPDELRGLHWDEVDLDGPQPGISITRTMRHSGGTKTTGRRRGLGLPQLALDALKRHRKAQAAERLAAGKRWEDNDLVFCTRLGRPVDRGNIARAFKTICANAGVEDAANRVPYEMRHTYASLIHDDGVPAEEIAQELGHSGTRVFEAVYRHVLRPQRLTGQTVMDRITAQRTG
jgi:integrase